MWKKVKNYFLERFRQKNKTDLQKAFYLLLSTLTVLGFFCFLLLSHSFFWPGPIYLFGDVMGIIGCLWALYYFRKGELESAGKVLIGFIIIVFTIHSVVIDFFRTDSAIMLTYMDHGKAVTDVFRTDPAIRYRIYVTFVCILGTFFLFISFFRNVRQLVSFTVLFIAILTAHFAVILYRIGGTSQMAFYAFEHYVTVCVGVIAATLISALLVTLIERLYSQAIEQGEVIRRQNDELHATVDEQTRFLVSSNDSLKEFAYLTSHDLREPLRNISGFITLIRKQCDTLDMEDKVRNEVHEYFDYVHQGVQQMEELISDIKEYSAINVLEKNFATVAMGDLAHQVRETLDAEITKSHATIFIQSNIPDVTGDKTLLYSLLLNLISNAIKYRKPDVAPVIHINYEHTDKGHVFAVKDNGIGIEEEYRERIFFAFKRLHGKQGAYSGTGLGLAICKKTVEIHGGDIWLESTPGEGSTFYFSLKD
jgi:signal transduction histidine kinase